MEIKVMAVGMVLQKISRKIVQKISWCAVYQNSYEKQNHMKSCMNPHETEKLLKFLSIILSKISLYIIT